MNYVGHLVFIIALVFTWKLPDFSNDPSLNVHTEIQNKISDLIVSSVEKSRPMAKEVRFHKIWTKAKNAQKIGISFHYSIVGEEGDLIESASGNAFAEVKKENSKELWVIHSVKVDEIALRVVDGLSVVVQ